MNGAEALIDSVVACGVEVCFANPGTTEMQLVGALDSVAGMRSILCLFEGVVTGAADGYARMADKPAMTLLHLGPGFANGIANAHNARRARMPMLNVIGDHPSWHVARDAPLTSDIEGLARPISKWLRRSPSALQLPRDAVEAIAAARAWPRGIATLIVPGDSAWDSSRGRAAAPEFASAARVDDASVDAAAKRLEADTPSALLLAGEALRGAGLRAAGRIAARTGCRLLSETFVARAERGAGLPAIAKLPYFPEQIRETLAAFADVLLVGTDEPVAFFGYPGSEAGVIPDDCRMHTLATPAQDVVAGLEALAERVGAAAAVPGVALSRPSRPSGPLDPGSIGAAIASVQPEHAILMDEAATTGFPYWVASAGCPPHDYLGLTGGAIGQGLPCATGAAVACPDRPVIAFQADGSGMYTLQALWTQAREELDVTTVICANREYRILRVELARADIASPGPSARALTSLADPALDWVQLSEGMGVPATRVERAEDLAREIERAVAEPGPHLIEALF